MHTGCVRARAKLAQRYHPVLHYRYGRRGHVTSMTAIPADVLAMDGTRVEQERAVLEVSPLESGGAELYTRSAKGRKVSMNIRLDRAGALDLVGALQDLLA